LFLNVSSEFIQTMLIWSQDFSSNNSKTYHALTIRNLTEYTIEYKLSAQEDFNKLEPHQHTPIHLTEGKFSEVNEKNRKFVFFFFHS
jgi:hypothetical protein